MTRRRALLALGALCLSGCGGGGGGEFVTREVEATLDRDALALATRDAVGLWLPRALATAYDADLRALRAAHPELAQIHARVGFDPHELHFAVANDAPWRAAWDAGNLTTGEALLDQNLQQLRAVRVERLEESGDRTWYALRFDQWLRMKAVAFVLYDKSPAVRSVSLVQGDEPETDIGLWRSEDNAILRLNFDGLVFERSRGDTWRTINCAALGGCTFF